MLNYGPDAGKLATIVDIVDQNKCLIEGPSTGVGRKVVSYGRIALTDFTVSIPRDASTDEISAAWEESGVQSKWDETAWAKKLVAKSKRAKLSDFERFKVQLAKKKKSAIIAKKMKELA